MKMVFFFFWPKIHEQTLKWKDYRGRVPMSGFIINPGIFFGLLHESMKVQKNFQKVFLMTI